MVSIGRIIESLIEVGAKEVHSPHHLAVIIHAPWFGCGGGEQKLFDTTLATLKIAVGAGDRFPSHFRIFFTAYSTVSHLH